MKGKLVHLILYYIFKQLMNSQVAWSLMNEIKHVYDNLEYNPKSMHTRKIFFSNPEIY